MAIPCLPTVDSAAVWRCVPTTDNVAFICIDDGYLAPGGDPAEAGDFVQNEELPVTPFLTFYAATVGGFPPLAPEEQEHVDYLKRFVAPGRGVQCHAKTHADLTGVQNSTPPLTYAQQLDLITKGKDFLSRADMFGLPAPTLFRPPFGRWNNDTRLAAFAAGFKVVVTWTHVFSDLLAEKPVTPGSVLLLHFTENLLSQLTVAAAAIEQAGLTPAFIEDYVR